MKLVFYYHISILVKQNKLFLPAYLGVFVSSLAKHVAELTLFMHETNQDNSADYLLEDKNISFVSLGIKTSFFNRVFFNKSILKEKMKLISDKDYLLIRSPSPLAPFFPKYSKIKVVYLIVGDYFETAKTQKITSIRSFFSKYLTFYVDILLRKQLITNHVIVNSPLIQKKYSYFLKKIDLIKTTTLTENDFYQRKDTCVGKEINILYSGRFDMSKGLLDLIEAFNIISKEMKNIKLNFVGWDEDENQSFLKKMKKLISKYDLDNMVVFHGFKKVGEELNKIYKKSDIFIITSYNEGFPRTIWEAMANSLPVISTDVGAIPMILADRKNSLLIKPKNISNIYDSIKTIITNKKLRKKIINSGYNLARTNTLENQTKMLIKFIKNKSN